MSKIQEMRTLLKNNLQNSQQGIYSVCSSHETVLKVALNFAKTKNYPLVIESTSNQVNQFGGYTGMLPVDFVNYVENLANEVGYPLDKLILGGDHLGPNVWQAEPAATAMQKSCDLVRSYIEAGYRKIHLDASMSCAGDEAVLTDEIVAHRAAELCRVAETTWQSLNDGTEAPVYIIGTEVPVPGGSQENEEELQPTSVSAAQTTYNITKTIFHDNDLSEAWQRVIALVIQPGVEFSDDNIFHYQAEKSKDLSSLVHSFDLVFEAHSTDYQSKENLNHLVNNHFAILKVGPWLTYAYREALFNLAHIENTMYQYGMLKQSSNFLDKMLDFLGKNPQYWDKYYHGSTEEIRYKCLYSLSDRIRYYWTNKDVQNLVAALMNQLGEQVLPYSLVSSYFPYAITELPREQHTAPQLIAHHIEQVLSQYEYAIE